MQESCSTKIKIPRSQFLDRDGNVKPLEIGSKLDVQLNGDYPRSFNIGVIKGYSKKYIEVGLSNKDILDLKESFTKLGWIFENSHNHPYTTIFI